MASDNFACNVTASVSTALSTSFYIDRGRRVSFAFILIPSIVSYLRCVGIKWTLKELL